jgi:hypothetical protein
MQPNIRQRANFKVASAFTEGTPIVAYSPAVLTDAMTISLEFAFDAFPEELFQQVSKAFGSLAGVPLLLP